MVQKIDVFYEGWGERFHWATLGAADLRSPVIFEYTEAAFQRGLELSPYLLPLQRGRDFSKVLFRWLQRADLGHEDLHQGCAGGP